MINFNKRDTIKLTQMALLAAISILLLMFVRIPLIPATPFLVYDMADIPIIIGTLMYGSLPGLIILLVVSTIQAFLFGGDGWIGLVMHFCSSGALIVCIGIANKLRKKKESMMLLIVGMVIGVLAMTTIMIPMNYIFTVNFYGMPKEVLDSLILTAIVPFNLIKGSANCIIAIILYKLLKPFIYKNKRILQ